MKIQNKLLSLSLVPLIGALLPAALPGRVPPGETPRMIPPKIPMPEVLNVPADATVTPAVAADPAAAAEADPVPSSRSLHAQARRPQMPPGETPWHIPSKVTLPPDLEALLENPPEVQYGAPDRPVLDPQAFIQNASDLIEDEVRNSDGERLGMLSDIVINSRNGQIELVAVGDGPSGVRLVPPQTLEPAPEANHLVLQADPQQWEETEVIPRETIDLAELEARTGEIYDRYGLNYRSGFDETAQAEQVASRDEQRRTEANRLPGDPVTPRSTPPVMAPDRAQAQKDARWEREFGSPQEREVRTGAESSAQDPQAASDPSELVWSSHLLGRTLVDTNEEPVGQISDLILDLHVGYVQHMIASTDGADPERFALPFNDFEISGAGPVVVQTDLSDLADAPVFDPESARLRRFEAFRYEEDSSPQFGEPARDEETSQLE